MGAPFDRDTPTHGACRGQRQGRTDAMSWVEPQPSGDDLRATVAWTRRWRDRHRWSQERLAEALGYDVSYLAKIEQGRRRPTEQFVARLADVTETPTADILGLAGRPSAGARLPAQDGPLLGRGREVDEVSHLVIAGTHLVSLVGVPGIGKSSLAIEVASGLGDRLGDGASFVAVGEASDSASFGSAVVHGLGLVEWGGRDSGTILVEALRHRELLLVIDHVRCLPGARALVRRLLDGCPGVHVLVTGRAALGLAGEAEYLVRPLALPDPARDSVDEALSSPAVKVFVAARRRVQPDFVLDEGTMSSVVDVCARLQGHPLAISLAASATSLSAGDLAVALGGILERPTNDDCDRPLERCLGAVLDLTRDGLPCCERQLIECLGTFSAGCSLGAVEAVCSAAPGDVLAGLAGLERKNVIVATVTAEGDSRFTCMEVLRHRTVERLGTAASRHALMDRHCRYYVDLATEAEPAMTGGAGQVGCLRRLEIDHANLAAAFRWALAHRPERALRLGAALWRFYSFGRVSEGLRLIGSAVQVGGGPSVDRIRCLSGLGVLARSQGDLRRAAALFGQAAALAAEDRLTLELAFSVLNQGILALGERAYRTARNRFHDALVLYEGCGDSRGIAHVHNCLGVVAHRLADRLGASEAFLAAVARFRALDDICSVAVNASNLGWTAEADGLPTEAHQWYQEALQIWEYAGDGHGRACAMADLGRLARLEGDLVQARVLVAKAIRTFDGLGDQPLAAACRLELEAIYAEWSRRHPARRLFSARPGRAGCDPSNCDDERNRYDASVNAMSDRSLREAPDPGAPAGDHTGAASLCLSRSDAVGLSVRVGLTESGRTV